MEAASRRMHTSEKGLIHIFLVQSVRLDGAPYQ